MGCYDTLNVSRLSFRLPRPPFLEIDISWIDFNNIEYQTKDLGQGMGHYMFRENRRLYELVRERCNIEKESPGYHSDSIQEKWVFRDDVTDYIVFYDYIRNDAGPYDFAIDYRAHVVNGVLSSVEVLKWETWPNHDRKVNVANLSKALRGLEEWNNRRLVKFLYRPYVRGVRTLFRWWRKAANRIPSSYELEFLLVDPKGQIDRQIRIRKKRN